MMGHITSRCYNITEWQVGAVDLRHNNSKILPLNKSTIAHSPVMLKALPDTAATAQYLHTNALPHCSHITRTTSGPTVHVANGNTIKPDLRATLKLSNKISSKVQSAHIFNDITTGYLISMRQLCDDSCISIFTKFDVKILKHNQVIITGLRDHTNVLWNIPLDPSSPTQQSPKISYPNQANGILRHDTTNHKLPQYFHA